MNERTQTPDPWPENREFPARPRIALLCPSRNRPESLAATADNLVATSKRADLLVYVDDDQERDYVFRDRWGGRLKIMVGPQGGMTVALNALAAAHLEEYDIFGHMTDDSTILTAGWEEHVEKSVATLPNGIGVVLPAHDDPQYPGYPLVTRKMIQLLGWYALPGTVHWGWDLVLQFLGQQTKLVNMKPRRFYIRHRQDRIQTSDAGHYQGDREAARRWIEVEGVSLAEELRGVAWATAAALS